MDDFLTIFRGLDTHGPGTPGDTLAALALVPTDPQRILDIGCGPGNAVPTARSANLPFAAGSFDLMWCEASVYCMGFEAALNHWKAFLAPDGTLVVSDLVWLRTDPPEEVRAFWADEYPDIQLLDARRAHVVANGYDLVGTHAVGHDAWAASYEPLSDRVAEVRSSLGDASVADALLAEVAMLKRQREGAFIDVFFVMQPR